MASIADRPTNDRAVELSSTCGKPAPDCLGNPSQAATAVLPRCGNPLAATRLWLLAEAVSGLSAMSAYDPPVSEQPTSQPAVGETVVAEAPTDCTVVSVDVAVGDEVTAGDTVAVVEMMKIEHLVAAPVPGMVSAVSAEPGQVVAAGAGLVAIEASAGSATNETGGAQPSPQAVQGSPGLSAAVLAAAPHAAEDSARGASQGSDALGSAAVSAALSAERADLAELAERRSLLDDSARPEAVAKIHARQRRTARENIADLVDPGSFSEYGRFMYAAQTARRDRADLMANTPGDGIVGGLATINAEAFGDAAACAVMSYDYTVLAGTQGFRGHQKKDRLLEIVDRLRCPVVLFAEGGGGRPGDTDQPWLAGLHLMSFAWMSRLSGEVPTVAIVSGRCFAGNAALAAVCDAIVATPDANLGMAGPAMIEGGGLGVFDPSEIGPVDVQAPNGVIDVLADDEAHAVALTRRYLAYFQGALADFEAHPQGELRTIVPENRKRPYDVRRVVELLCDAGTTMELRPSFGRSVVTVLGRLAGRPVGIVANDPLHLGGAIDSDSAESAARFMGLCDSFGLPLVTLCDTPGFMVGPEAERSGQIRSFGRMFVTGAKLGVPTAAVVLRKAVGLGAMAMVGGSLHSNLMSVAWPTGEFSGMGIEGAVTLGARRRLEAVEDPEERLGLWERLVAEMYDESKALNAAVLGEIDDVIDPAETRDRLIALLAAAAQRRSEAPGH